MALNLACRLYPQADLLFFGDERFYTGIDGPGGHRPWFKEDVDAFDGLRVSCAEKLAGTEGLNVVRRKWHPFGIERNPASVRWNLSTGGAAVNLAVHLGVNRIVLVGYDMRLVNGKRNWHDAYPGVSNSARNPYEKLNKRPGFLVPFTMIADELKVLGVGCVNSTPGSALRVFPNLSLKEALLA